MPPDSHQSRETPSDREADINFSLLRNDSGACVREESQGEKEQADAAPCF